MIVSINQPAYLPWLGYFHRIAVSDLHIVLDHVQFEKNGFTNRNKVRTSNGSTWLTVPVKTKGKFGDLPIDRLEIDNSGNWREKHWATIRQCYGKARHFPDYRSFFEHLYSVDWDHLVNLTREITDRLLHEGFQIKTPLLYSSKMNVTGQKSELVLNLCKEVRATTYLSGPLGRDYLDKEAFSSAGIAIQYHDYIHPVYEQAYSGFEQFMGAIDLLFMHGPDSLHILNKANSSNHGAQ